MNPTNTRLGVSLVIISLNEEANIERCIRSVPWADDIVVLDSGSQDRTVEIARSLGARVFVEKWRGYRDQKVRATELAKNDWVLSLDADEALSPEADSEIKKLMTSGASTRSFDGVEFPRLSYNMGRWIHHGGWYPDWQIRLFDRKRANWSEGHVHERIVSKNKLRVRQPLLHWPFADISDQIETNNRYSTLGARDLFERGRKFSVLQLIFKPWSKFIETYFIKRGLLDGLPGFVIAVGAAYSVFLKFAKLNELEQRNSAAPNDKSSRS